MRKILFATVAACLVCLVSSAHAAVVSFNLVADLGGTFDLFAESSALDNGGIASYGVVLTGGVLTVDHNSPVDLFANFVGPYGFSLLRSGDNITSIAASQDTIGQPARTIYGFGQNASDFASEGVIDSTGGTGVEGDPWNVPLLIASGTWDGQEIGINASSVNTLANVFSQSGQPETESASINTSVEITVIPEPGTLLLACCGLIGLVAGRRRC